MRKFKTIFLEEAVEFLDGLTEQARNKIFYNIFRVEGGMKSNDLFKKYGFELSHCMYSYSTMQR